MNESGMSLLSAGYPATNQNAQVEMMTEVYVYLNHEHGVMNHEPWFSEGKKKKKKTKAVIQIKCKNNVRPKPIDTSSLAIISQRWLIDDCLLCSSFGKIIPLCSPRLYLPYYFCKATSAHAVQSRGHLLPPAGLDIRTKL